MNSSLISIIGSIVLLKIREKEKRGDFIENSVSRIYAWNSNGGTREGSEIYIELPVIRWKGKYVRFSRANEKATGNRVSAQIKSRAPSIIDRRAARRLIAQFMRTSVTLYMYFSPCTGRYFCFSIEIRMRNMRFNPSPCLNKQTGGRV